MSRDTRNLKLIIAYNGARYHGWQRQAVGIDSVQLRIEQAAKRVLKHPLCASGCSRTDAGVHAEGQVVNIHTTNKKVPLDGMQKAMNSRLPDDIAVRSVAEVADDFQASYSAMAKTYRYRIFTGPQRPVALAGLVWKHWRSFEVEPMRVAARRLLGEHDFSGLAGSLVPRKNTIRTIYRCDVVEQPDEIQIFVTGNGFLFNMVRNIAGTLVDAGRGRWGPEQIDLILKTGDRTLAGPTAPPDGLTLMRVHYVPRFDV
jgi:tRNA pseudouridine38-40 synthase